MRNAARQKRNPCNPLSGNRKLQMIADTRDHPSKQPICRVELWHNLGTNDPISTQRQQGQNAISVHARQSTNQQGLLLNASRCSSRESADITVGVSIGLRSSCAGRSAPHVNAAH